MGLKAEFDMDGKLISQENIPSDTDKHFDELATIWVDRSWDRLEKIIDDEKNRPGDRKEDSA